MIQIAHIERLFQKHYRPAVYYSERIVHRHDIAEDIVQGVFEVLMRPDITVQENLQSYFYSAVHHRSLDYLTTRKITVDESRLVNLPVSGNDAELYREEFAEAQHLKRLYEAIESLPEKRRQIFRMVQIERLSYAETASRLGISLNSVRTQMHRALSVLKSRFRR